MIEPTERLQVTVRLLVPNLDHVHTVGYKQLYQISVSRTYVNNKSIGLPRYDKQGSQLIKQSEGIQGNQIPVQMQHQQEYNYKV